MAKSTPAAIEATIVPSVPAAPKTPCVVDERPTGVARATTAYSAGPRSANEMPSKITTGMTRIGSTSRA